MWQSVPNRWANGKKGKKEKIFTWTFLCWHEDIWYYNDIRMVVVWLECWLKEISQIVECCARGGFEADICSFAHLHHFHWLWPYFNWKWYNFFSMFFIWLSSNFTSLYYTCVTVRSCKNEHSKLSSWFCYWSLLYSAILRFRADSLRSHVILHEWIAFYSVFLNIHQSGVLTAAISARSVYTIQPCTMSLHAKPHP